MTEILGLIQFLLIVYILFNEFKHKSSAVFLWATLFIMFGVMHLLASFGGDSEYSDSVLSKASLFVILFCAFYIVVRNTFGTKVLAENEELMSYESLIRKQNDENYDINILFVVFLIVFFAKVLPFLHYAGDIMSTSWGTGRGYTDSLNYVNSLQIIKIFFYALSGVTVCFWLRKNYLIMSTIVALSLFDVLLTRNRIEILPIACSLIAIFIFKNKRISFKVVILGAVLSVLVVYMVYGLRVFRHYGTLQTFINNFMKATSENQINLSNESIIVL